MHIVVVYDVSPFAIVGNRQHTQRGIIGRTFRVKRSVRLKSRDIVSINIGNRQCSRRHQVVAFWIDINIFRHLPHIRVTFTNGNLRWIISTVNDDGHFTCSSVNRSNSVNLGDEFIVIKILHIVVVYDISPFAIVGNGQHTQRDIIGRTFRIKRSVRLKSRHIVSINISNRQCSRRHQVVAFWIDINIFRHLTHIRVTFANGYIRWIIGTVDSDGYFACGSVNGSNRINLGDKLIVIKILHIVVVYHISPFAIVGNGQHTQRGITGRTFRIKRSIWFKSSNVVVVYIGDG